MQIFPRLLNISLGRDYMIGGGFSIQGTYHEKNQDSYWVGAVSGGYVAALSDGLGSCKYSEIGSRALCEVVRELANSKNCFIDDADFFARQVEDYWRIGIRHKLYKIEDCHATALFAIVGEKHTWLFRLGDGVIGAKFKGGVAVLRDPKEDGYLNITDCLGISSYNWEKFCIATDIVQGIFIFSDGVTNENDEANLKELMEGIYAEYAGHKREEIEKDLAHWVPTMKSRDDKTLAFLLAADKKGVLG